MFNRFKEIFAAHGYTDVGKYDGWCPKSTVINVYGDRKELMKLIKMAFDMDMLKIYLDDKAFNWIFSDLSNYGRHSSRLTIY